MAIAVRRATAADADLVSVLNADVQAIHAAAFPQRFKSPGPETFPPPAAATLIARSGNLVFIAEADGEPVGYAYAEVIRRPETAFHHAHDFDLSPPHQCHAELSPARRWRGVA